MKISFHGAAKTVTGSKHLVHIGNTKQLLLDCGMFQGMGKETYPLNSHWGFEPSEVDYVIISHAHIDHIGLLPKLVKDGYKGSIYCTRASTELIKLLLLDSANIQESDTRYTNKYRQRTERDLYEPLYTVEDAEQVIPLLIELDYGKWERIDDDIELMYTDNGHILGSAAVNLRLKEEGKKVALTFSGDIGRYRDTILRSPETFPQADYIIMESTYGDKLHPESKDAIEALLNHIVHTCLIKKGKLIIPAFSLGRTQELLYILNTLEEQGRLPPISYVVDSPLSTKITRVVKSHPECFNRDVRKMLETDKDVFNFKGLRFTESVDDSIALNDSREPMVIISASGMAEAGRVKHHIKNTISDTRNTILIVGYCEPQSLGGRLRAGADKVSIFGMQFEVNAEVKVIDTMSAHGDYEDMSQWLACQDAKLVRKLFLVHGEPEVQEVFKDKLLRKGFDDVLIPNQHETIGLGDLS
jgi:metallo-beta-lactamase family protein